MKTRYVLGAIITAAIISIPVSPVRAQEYPVKPITLIVPWGAGGPTDIQVRAFAEAAQKHLGQPIVIDNKPGGGGSVGPATMAATAKPDGYTIAQMPFAVYRMPIMQKASYDPQNDFTYIASVSGYAFGVAVAADSPFKTWQDVVDYAKANPNKVTYASAGTASTPHLGTEMVARHAGIKLVHVPFKSSPEMHSALLGGHVMLSASGSSAKPLVEAGKMRFIQVWSRQRLSMLPDVPTLRELGYPFDFEEPLGFAGPKGMDSKITQKLHDAFKAALDDTNVKQIMKNLEVVPAYMNGADFKAYLRKAMDDDRQLMTEIGLAAKEK